MNSTLTPEQKKQRIETIVKILGLGVVGFLVAPIIFVTIQGLIGLAIAAALSFGIIAFIPYFAMLIGNWRLKAIKAEAAKNPVETLQNQLIEKQSALNAFMDNIRKFTAQVLSFADQVKQYTKDGLEDAPVYVEQLAKMRQLLELRKQKYQDAKDMLVEFERTIQQTDRKWKMALAATAMNEAAGKLTGDTFDQICVETALSSVQDKLNQSFADLEIALLDDDKAKAKKMYQDKQAKVTSTNPEFVTLTNAPLRDITARQ